MSSVRTFAASVAGNVAEVVIGARVVVGANVVAGAAALVSLQKTEGKQEMLLR